jgi:hypothetical protein
MVKTKYDPRVEEKREDYTRLAESIVFMLELNMNREGSRLDVACERFEGMQDAITRFRQTTGQHSRPTHDILMGALTEHLNATFHAPDLLDPDTIRMFYVELRLLADQQELDRRISATRPIRP